MSENGGIRVLERALGVLDHMARTPGRTGITDIAEGTGLPKATVHRILQTLGNKKVVVQGDDGGYSIGPAVLYWSDSFRARSVLPHLAHPVIKKLWEATKETVHLTAYDGETAYYVDKLESPHPVGMRSRIGAELCLHTTAAGRSIMAAMDKESLDSYLEKATFEKKTTSTIATREELEALLDDIRLRGYGWENQENEEGIRCIGSAILRGKHRPIGAISVSIPAYRLDEGDVPSLGEAVKKAAENISKLIDGTDQVEGGR
ncbi:IclR family transcriptional regulator [Dethiosulfovibrio salsuginis]|uniref:Transcriptional regulator, IclR family n=1 Tax=Dethiosulfovibrio salsuginis TaxID=561720 RepID=A0A1X7IS82_9BACT|nr:IclR family transcriptional regulator [Dethiosulfovibrio salsuginis]SMG17676.1 transcriptional regulator, IclR family [Dethiosulfovibrio salsuginis]